MIIAYMFPFWGKSQIKQRAEDRLCLYRSLPPEGDQTALASL